MKQRRAFRNILAISAWSRYFQVWCCFWDFSSFLLRSFLEVLLVSAKVFPRAYNKYRWVQGQVIFIVRFFCRNFENGLKYRVRQSWNSFFVSKTDSPFFVLASFFIDGSIQSYLLCGLNSLGKASCSIAVVYRCTYVPCHPRCITRRQFLLKKKRASRERLMSEPPVWQKKPRGRELI